MPGNIDQIVQAASCFRCIPRGMQSSVATYLMWLLVASGLNPIPHRIVLEDELGGFWLVVIDPMGNVGLSNDSGPATPQTILSDGGGGFWLLVANSAGMRGTTSNPGPATPIAVIDDGSGGNWSLVVDTSGNLGATSV